MRSDDAGLVSDLLGEHGELAEAAAMQRALDARAVHDPMKEAMWLRVFDSIRALADQGKKPPKGLAS